MRFLLRDYGQRFPDYTPQEYKDCEASDIDRNGSDLEESMRANALMVLDGHSGRDFGEVFADYGHDSD